MAINFFSDFYRNKKVLVTGHTGFKGAWLTQWLLELGAHVGGFSLDVPTEPSLFETLELHFQIEDFRGDIRNLDELKSTFEKFKPEIVFHLAAQSLVRSSYDNPLETFSTNIMGTACILEAIKSCPSVKQFINITSDKCYENQEWVFGYREIDAMGGKDPYSASKGCAELVFSSYFKSFFQDLKEVSLCSARAGNVIGGGDWAADRIVPDCIRAWSKHQPVILRNPKSIRPWQYVLESLSGYLWLGVKAKSFSGEAFNFGPRTDLSRPVNELVEALKKDWPSATLALSTETQSLENLPSDLVKKESTLLKLDISKATHHLGWHSVLSLQQTLQMTSHWYQRFYMKSGSMVPFTKSQIQQYCVIAGEQKLPWAK